MGADIGPDCSAPVRIRLESIVGNIHYRSPDRIDDVFLATAECKDGGCKKNRYIFYT